MIEKVGWCCVSSASSSICLPTPPSIPSTKMRIYLPTLLFVVAAATGQAEIFYAGVAESGGEFGVWSPDGKLGAGLPGEFGVDYRFIDRKGVDVFVDVNKVSFVPGPLS